MSVSRITLAMLSASLLLGACAGLPTARGQRALTDDLSARGLAQPDPTTSRDVTDGWLAEPLSVDRAIQIALIRNPELRAESAKLGFAAADVYEAGRLANPLLSATWLSSGSEPHTQLTLGIAINFTDLLLLGRRSDIANAEFDSMRLALGNASLNLAAQVEASYRQLAAATQIAELKATLAQAAQHSATLAQRWFDAGNLKRRDLALEQAAATQAQLDTDAAALDATLARQAFARLLGLPSSANWTLAEALALPPAQDEALSDLQQFARESRLDVASARRHVDAVAARHGLTRRTRLLGDIEIGAEREREYDGSVHSGPTLAFALPLFDWGAGRKARGEAELQTAEAELAARELDADHDVAAAHARLQNARLRSERYRRELVPARETAVEQTQREVNYMLADVFELLAARQQGDEAYAGYLAALGDYWAARADLARAVGRRLPLPTAPTTLQISNGRPQIADAATPDQPSHQHEDNAHAQHQHAAPATPDPCDMSQMDMTTMSAEQHEQMMLECMSAPAAPAHEHGAH